MKDALVHAAVRISMLIASYAILAVWLAYDQRECPAAKRSI